MSGNPLGAIKAKLGLKGQTKPGEMISRMNQMKGKVLEKKSQEESKVAVIKKII